MSSAITQKDVRDAIPAHFFKQDTLSSSYYVVRDAIQSIITVVVMQAALEHTPSVFHIALWPLFWFVQGLNWTGLWVLAHECGHQAFSPSKTINDAVGLVLHSFLLVPYHSWRISHGNHHKHTNHMEKDTVFVPQAHESFADIVQDSPIASVVKIIVMVTLGWPAYLLANLAGQKYDRRANHFEPSSPLFKPTDKKDVIESDIGILVAVTSLAAFAYTYGFGHFLCWYFFPYLWVNYWLVSITYLQHTDVRVPHYTAEQWTFFKGAIATVDRDYGVLNWWFHHITDSHVVHHLFSTMPFYNAIQATPIVKKKLGKLYMCDERPVLKCLWESFTHCLAVVPDADGLLYFKKQ
jgi:omega-6 fatty acid desaturase / acyl-lipid omega-6 desaturase (Delta-12 desaturase)